MLLGKEEGLRQSAQRFGARLPGSVASGETGRQYPPAGIEPEVDEVACRQVAVVRLIGGISIRRRQDQPWFGRAFGDREAPQLTRIMHQTHA